MVNIKELCNFLIKRILVSFPSLQIFMNNQKYYTVEENKAGSLVDNAARNIENFLKKRAKALEVLYSEACFKCVTI